MNVPTPTTPETLTAAGWRPRSGSGFNAALGEIWFGPKGEAPPRIGLFIGEGQANTFKRVHGGALMTLADICLGYAASSAANTKSMVTADLHVQFIAGADVGSFLVGHAEVIRSTRSLIFVRGLLACGDTVVASASGIWKVLEKNPARGGDTVEPE